MSAQPSDPTRKGSGGAAHRSVCANPRSNYEVVGSGERRSAVGGVERVRSDDRYELDEWGKRFNKTDPD